MNSSTKNFKRSHEYEKGLSKQEIIDIFILIDWLMVLPEAMEETFKDKLLQFEQEQEMSYITSIERIGRKEGQNEGVLIGGLNYYALKVHRFCKD